MAQVVVGVVFEAHRSSRRPLRMLLGSSLLRQTRHLNLLAFAQLANQRSPALRIGCDGCTYARVDGLADDDEIPCVDGHLALAASRV